MANRHTLHINAIDDFKKWLVCDGWELQTPKGYYEVIRAKKGNRLFMAYRRLNNNLQHLSTTDKDARIIYAYIKSKKKQIYFTKENKKL